MILQAIKIRRLSSISSNMELEEDFLAGDLNLEI